MPRSRTPCAPSTAPAGDSESESRLRTERRRRPDPGHGTRGRGGSERPDRGSRHRRDLHGPDDSRSDHRRGHRGEGAFGPRPARAGRARRHRQGRSRPAPLSVRGPRHHGRHQRHAGAIRPAGRDDHHRRVPRRRRARPHHAARTRDPVRPVLPAHTALRRSARPPRRRRAHEPRRRVREPAGPRRGRQGARHGGRERCRSARRVLPQQLCRRRPRAGGRRPGAAPFRLRHGIGGGAERGA